VLGFLRGRVLVYTSAVFLLVLAPLLLFALALILSSAHAVKQWWVS